MTIKDLIDNWYASQTLFFHDWKVIGARFGYPGGYGHSFGGPPRHATTRPEQCGETVHLLHNLNLSDPLFGLRIPNVQWLSLYYCFEHRQLGYRLLSDSEMQLFFDEPRSSTMTEGSTGDSSTDFPRYDIELYGVPYDPTDLSDAYSLAPVFGLDRLSPADLETVLEREARNLAREGFRKLSPAQIREQCGDLFLQGNPKNVCPNPECGFDRLNVFAIVNSEPLPNVRLFGADGEDLMLVFEMCLKCFAIHASSQST